MSNFAKKKFLLPEFIVVFITLHETCLIYLRNQIEKFSVLVVFSFWQFSALNALRCIMYKFLSLSYFITQSTGTKKIILDYLNLYFICTKILFEF